MPIVTREQACKDEGKTPEVCAWELEAADRQLKAAEYLCADFEEPRWHDACVTYCGLYPLKGKTVGQCTGEIWAARAEQAARQDANLKLAISISVIAALFAVGIWFLIRQIKLSKVSN